MAKKITAIRGMNDILPAQTPLWQHLEQTVRQLMSAYAYQEIRLPVMESTDLFCRSIGDVTDIVEKEMYTFDDRNGDSLSLRPEGTASCVRAGEEHGLLYNQVQRLWYAGPMFRYERPQKGRYRQFHQIGVETFGMAGPDIDAELIFMTARLWQQLGLSELVELQINSLGSNEARANYREALVTYLTKHQGELDDDSVRRLESNPLRVLDSKNPSMQAMLSQAPNLLDYLDDESKAHFEQLQHMLTSAGIRFVINPRLVRGLDYYNATVFEWVTEALGAQGTVCAGGRYDGLVSQLGGKATPAVGFAMGIERLILLLEQKELALPEIADVYIAAVGGEEKVQALLIAEQLRSESFGVEKRVLRVLTHCGTGGFKAQMKKADKSGAVVAIIVGEEELKNKQVTVKFLRQQKEQESILIEDLGARLSALLDEQ